jgi:hypothetical protein
VELINLSSMSKTTQWETRDFAALEPVNVEITAKIPEGLFFVIVD